ncbi:FdhF/YdeP family oxidoreductase [Polycladidibacter stylochi]|uniref:FdhF/YdeP family oxidoreductase n=1 Tax=Polycladidibacter stylochi TaxID=1807766 RepID=UPI00082BC855|nr:FdhF/YdeP family oxidoreductase [Pseudovibrio stylochi]
MSKKLPHKAYTKPAGGWGSITSAGETLIQNTDIYTGVKTLLKTNQPDGVVCHGCSWGKPDETGYFEFCENGVKTMAWETARRQIPESYIQSTPVRVLQSFSDLELAQLGRITQPLRYSRKSGVYNSVSWARALSDIASELKQLASPDEAIFYASGDNSNEAAFLYQLFGRMFGTNNFPRDENTQLESSNSALKAAIGTIKGTVNLSDFERTDLIFIIGHNPGSSSPRFMRELRKAVKRGVKIISINPLEERALQEFVDPRDPSELFFRQKTTISNYFMKVKSGGDMAVMRGIAKALFTWDYESMLGSGTLVQGFLENHCENFEYFEQAVNKTSWKAIEDQSGLTQRQIEEAARIYTQANRAIFCWGSGVTQHKHGYETVREIVNVALLRGNIGKMGAGLCPMRHQGNAQGITSMGLSEQPNPQLLKSLERVFRFEPNTDDGVNSFGALNKMLSGEAKVFMGLGGNFLSSQAERNSAVKAMDNMKLTVHIGSSLNRTHLHNGEKAYILPCLNPTEMDTQKGGEQITTYEDNLSVVRGSTGPNRPIGELVRSPVSIIAGIAKETVGRTQVNWDLLCTDYGRIRQQIEQVLPGYKEFNFKIQQGHGYYLSNSARDRDWQTASGRAEFSYGGLPEKTVYQQMLSEPEPCFVLQATSSHDQLGLRIFSENDRYRGIRGTRKVVFMNPKDIRRAGLREGANVDLKTVGTEGDSHKVHGFTVVSYDCPEGCVAAYYPEVNALVPLDSHGEESPTPAFKSIPVSIKISGAS